MILWWWS